MGEITEALRRARHERSREDHRPGAVDAPEATEASPGRSELAPPETEAPTPRELRSLPPRPDERIVEISRAKTGAWAARSILLDHPLAECFRQFAIRVRLVIETRSNPIVMVTSALRHEGKTTVACNLALALASMAAERRVALVDLDLHRSGVASALDIRPAVGLERVLDGRAPLSSARLCTDVPALDVFAVGKPRSHAHAVFSSRHFGNVAAELANGYDVVVIDTPPVLPVPDVSLIAPHVGGWLAVVHAGNTPTSAFREMLRTLSGDLLIGCFLNDAPLARHARYGDYHADSDLPAGEDSAVD